jgi:hypothetical protein
VRAEATPMAKWQPDRVFYPHFHGKGNAPTLPQSAIDAYGEKLTDALYQASLKGDPSGVLGAIGDCVRAYDKTGVYTTAFEEHIRRIVGITEATDVADIYAIWVKAMTTFVRVIDAFEVGLGDYDNDSTKDDPGDGGAKIMHALPIPDTSTAG